MGENVRMRGFYVIPAPAVAHDRPQISWYPNYTDMPTAPYLLLFGPACAVLLILIWREARRQRFSGDSVAAAMAACAAGAVIGSKILMFDFHDAQYGEKTFLGAVVGGMLTLALVGKVLRFDARAFDVPMIPILWAAAIGRVGCFVAGCCHGVATTLPWGVSYAPGSAAFRHQVVDGVIGAGAAASLAVHPTQLYESALDVALAVLLTRQGRRFRRPGSLALAGAVGIMAIRFLVDPLRATAVPALGLTMVQWTTLAVAVGCAIALTLRERRATVDGTHVPVVPWGETRAPALVLATVATLLLATRGWLTPLESMVVTFVLCTSAIIVARAMAPRLAFAGPALGFAAFIPMQLQDTVPSATPDSLTGNLYYALGGSAMIGGFEVITEDCEGNTTSRTKHRYKVAGISAEVRKETQPGVGSGFRVTAFNGQDNADRPIRYTTPQPGEAPGVARTYPISGVTAALEFDARYLGITAGVTGGKWSDTYEPPYFLVNGDPLIESQLMPVVGLRLGRKTGLHGEIGFNTHTPAPTPGPIARVGLAFGDTTGTQAFRIGVTEIGAYAGARLLSNNGFEFEPFVMLDGDRAFQFGAGVKKRFSRGR